MISLVLALTAPADAAEIRLVADLPVALEVDGKAWARPPVGSPSRSSGG